MRRRARDGQAIYFVFLFQSAISFTIVCFRCDMASMAIRLTPHLGKYDQYSDYDDWSVSLAFDDR